MVLGRMMIMKKVSQILLTLLMILSLTNTSENSPTSTGGEMNRFFVDFVMDEQYKICYNIFSNKYKKESKYQ